MPSGTPDHRVLHDAGVGHNDHQRQRIRNGHHLKIADSQRAQLCGATITEVYFGWRPKSRAAALRISVPT